MRQELGIMFLCRIRRICDEAESGVIDGNATAKQIADKLAAPTVKADKNGLEWQDVPEGVTVEFLADYEQVVGRDGKIYQRLERQL